MCLFVFFFKQKTAYEMRISDWSSDVCSSDLYPSRCFTAVPEKIPAPHSRRIGRGSPESELRGCGTRAAGCGKARCVAQRRANTSRHTCGTNKIGRASCRERVCQYV